MHEIVDVLGQSLRELQKDHCPHNNQATNRKRSSKPKTIDPSTIRRSSNGIKNVSNYHRELHRLESTAREIADQ